jgi:hypothetical protein
LPRLCPKAHLHRSFSPPLLPRLAETTEYSHADHLFRSVNPLIHSLACRRSKPFGFVIFMQKWSSTDVNMVDPSMSAKALNQTAPALVLVLLTKCAGCV